LISKKILLQRLRYNPLAKGRGSRGIALILAITSLMFMVYIASEVTKDSATEYIVNSQELTRLKAYYAARNSMQIALLRVKLFQQASKIQLPEGLASQLDLLWKFPFAWPLPIPPDLNAVDTDTMKKISAESLMDSTYTHTIDDEGSKIDVNDLASPSKTLREATKRQLLSIFEQRIASDDEFRGNYQSFNFNELVDKLQDWMSDTTTSGSGSGDKRAPFSGLGQGYPPNRGFRTIEEIRLVPGMTEEFFSLMAPRITIYGMKAINPNTASKEVLLSLDPGMTDEAVTEAISRRNDPQLGGPFKGNGAECLKDFKNFVESRGARLAPEFDSTPMLCSKVFNFRIVATGIYGGGKSALQKNIVAVVVDINRSAAQIKSNIDAEKAAEAGGTPADGAGSTSGASNQDPLPKGPPRIVYWTEY
jgi:general secretion pathway protein K